MKAVSITAAIAGVALGIAGAASIALAPWLGPALYEFIWEVEPITYIGVVLLALGLGLALLAVLALFYRFRRSEIKRYRAASRAMDFLTHDLKRPIDEMRGRARLLNGRVLEDLSAEQWREEFRSLAGEIETQTANFRLTMDNARVLADLDDPNAYLGFEPVNVPAIIEDVCTRYSYRGKMAGVEVQCCLPHDGDSGQMAISNGNAISQIVANLVDNAIRYARSTVRVQVGGDGDEAICIQVSDDGPGILPPYHELVYGRGWTAEVSEGKDPETSGMGLYISLELARRCGGRIQLESNASAGPDGSRPTHTTFTVILPGRPAGSRKWGV